MDKSAECLNMERDEAVCVCVCVLLDIGYQNTYSTNKVRTHLESEDI